MAQGPISYPKPPLNSEHVFYLKGWKTKAGFYLDGFIEK